MMVSAAYVSEACVVIFLRVWWMVPVVIEWKNVKNVVSHCLPPGRNAIETIPNQPVRGCFGPVLIECRKTSPHVYIRITDVQTV
jgi:hypothetical protein